MPYLCRMMTLFCVAVAVVVFVDGDDFETLEGGIG